MHSLFVNPISISFIFLAGLIVTIVSALDGNLREAVAIVFAPYLTDVAQPFARETTTLINGFLLTAQLAILIFITVYSRSGKKHVRILTATLGVSLVASYFLCLFAALFLSSIH